MFDLQRSKPVQNNLIDPLPVNIPLADIGEENEIFGTSDLYL